MAVTATGRRIRKRKLKAEINVVPYIDVMLVLLIIFMVTAPLISPGEIELPSVGSKLTVPAQPFEVTLRNDMTLWLRDQAANTPAVLSSCAVGSDLGKNAAAKYSEVNA